jgi:hypothetical protein
MRLRAAGVVPPITIVPVPPARMPVSLFVTNAVPPTLVPM